MDEERICHNFHCGYRTREKLHKCPECGRMMLTDRSFRQLGIVLAGLGLILAVGGGAVLWLVVANLDRFRGGTGAMILVLAIVGMLPTLGLTIIFAGLWQYAFGQANRWLVWGFVGMAAVVLIVGSLARMVL